MILTAPALTGVAYPNLREEDHMAEFKRAHAAMMKYEVSPGHSGYELVPGDRGGETYLGISRKWHGRLGLWTIIDDAKKSPEFPNNLKGLPALQEAVEDFYIDTFWTPLRGERIESQAIAEELYECAVNQGPVWATKHLQSALALLGHDVEVDGCLGPATLDALNAATRKGHEQTILRIQNALQGARYVDIMERDPSQRKFVGWFKRV